jgi:MFS family permease
MYIGSSVSSFELLVLGRFVYGLGGDSITAIQWALVMEYFHSEKEVGIALMMVYIFTTLGNSANLYFSPLIARVILD